MSSFSTLQILLLQCFPSVLFLLLDVGRNSLLGLLENLRVDKIFWNIWSNGLSTVQTSFRWDENIQVPRKDERGQNRNDDNVRQNEAEDVWWIVAQGVELGVPKAVDNS